MVDAPLRYLSAADVAASLPSVGERIELAARALVALARDDAEMPPKIGVHPRADALLHAMPAWLRSDDIVGLKWVSAFPGNRARGVPAIAALVVLNDAETGRPLAIMDGTVITAVRTAAVSGVAITAFRPSARRAAILGAGVQARSHLEMLAAVLPGVAVTVFDRHPERARAVADEAAALPGIAAARTADDPREAVRGADLVITVATLGSSSQVMTPDWVAPDALVVAVDFATYASAALARAARVFAVDDRAQFLTYRDGGRFDGYPEPSATLGDAWLARGRPGGAPTATDEPPVLATHLGVGLADVVFASALLARASASGAGVELPR